MSPIRDTGAPKRLCPDTLPWKGAGTIILILALTLATGAWADTFRGRVVGVSDGDTITVLHDGRGEPVRVRLNGIDAPERGQAFGTRAKAFTSDLAFGKTVSVRSDRRIATTGWSAT